MSCVVDYVDYFDNPSLHNAGITFFNIDLGGGGESSYYRWKTCENMPFQSFLPTIVATAQVLYKVRLIFYSQLTSERGTDLS